MRFRILGSLEAESASGMRLPLSGPFEQKLLAVLLLDSNRAIPVSRLVDALWDQPPVTAAKQVRNAVSRLRKLLAEGGMPDLIVTDGAGYRLVLGCDAVDVGQFEALMRQASTAAPRDQAVRLIASALGLWRGPALSGLTGQVLEAAAAGLDEQRNVAMETYYEHMLALGRHREIMPDLSAMAVTYPLRERLAGQLMLALYRSGRQADALRAYQRTRAALAEELGLDPGADLQRLHQQVLRANPGLAAPPSADGGQAHRPAAAQGAIPRQLPAVAGHFTGRSAELLRLDELLGESPPDAAHGVVLISAIGGTAGTGKTALAVRWAHQAAERFPDGQLYVNLCGYGPEGPVPAADALAGFLRALGVPGQDIPAGEAERAAQYRSLLATKRMLVILDNARSAEHARPLLPGTPSCAAVVTSRDALAGLVARDGARRLDLGPLPAGDAAALLRALIGARADADPVATADLAAQCSWLPLALRVAAELAAARPGMALTGLAGELASQQRRLDLLEAGGDSGTSLRTVFSWSCRHLDPAAARGFRLLSLHPGVDFEPYAAAALTGATMAQTAQILDVLARAHLIQQARPGWYGMHDLLRAYARELSAAHDGEQEQRASLTRLLDHYLHATAAAASDWLDDRRATLVAVTAHAATSGWPAHATTLAAALTRYLENGDHYPEAITIHSHARQAARQIRDRPAEAAALISLGRIDWAQGRCEQASSRLLEAHAICRAAGDPPGQARAANSLGLLELQYGRCDPAAGRFREALRLYRQTGDQDGQAVALGNLGVIHARQGRFRQAVECQQRALGIFRRSGDQAGRATALTRLGIAQLRMGGSEPAIGLLEEALRISRELKDRNSQGMALTWLGVAELRMGRYQQAIGCQEEAAALSRDIGDLDGEAQALNALGEVLLETGQPGEAKARHAAALGLASETGNAYHLAHAYDGLGCACHAAGDVAEACGYWEQALVLYAAQQAPDAGRLRAQLASAHQQVPAMHGHDAAMTEM
jgi:DNA-binding SARP family transcriptional activator/tetratricopeptide (TPR) repeat protein